MALTDHYVLYSWAFVLMVISTGLFVFRSTWLPLLEPIIPEHAYTRLMPYQSSFEADIEAGLSSDSFSLAGNVTDGDSRAGLDANAKSEILGIMKKKRITFDQARIIYLEQKMAKNGIGPDGRPLDPRAVFFS